MEKQSEQVQIERLAKALALASTDTGDRATDLEIASIEWVTYMETARRLHALGGRMACEG